MASITLPEYAKLVGATTNIGTQKMRLTFEISASEDIHALEAIFVDLMANKMPLELTLETPQQKLPL